MKEPAVAARTKGSAEKPPSDGSFAARRNSAGSTNATPLEAMLMPEATVWLMLFSTIVPSPSTPFRIANPRMAATVEPPSPNPSLSAM